MKERPIIFSAPMIRALLEGRKTVTRRIVKPQPEIEYRGGVAFGMKWQIGEGKFLRDRAFDNPDDFHTLIAECCPYGKVGDRLWVREVWRGGDDTLESVRYRTDDDCLFCQHDWKSPLFMPRWASRIDLELTGVRTEFLQDITVADAYNEGFSAEIDLNDAYEVTDKRTAIGSFRILWDSLYPDKPEKQWSANPLVWRLEFTRIKP